VRSQSLMWALCIVLVLSLTGVAATSAQAGQAELVIINFVGAEIVFTLDGTSYTIPGTDTIPDGGQLTLTLTPGRHTYSGHVPGSEGTNGEVTLASGESQVLGTRLERTDPVISPADVVLEGPRDVLVFFEASLAPTAPKLQPQPTPLRPSPAGQGALVFVNYIGEELIVDIGGALSTVPANGRLQIDLLPGEVSYSASGKTTGVTVKSAPNSALGSCVKSAVKKASFGKTKRGGSFVYPFVFRHSDGNWLFFFKNSLYSASKLYETLVPVSRSVQKNFSSDKRTKSLRILL